MLIRTILTASTLALSTLAAHADGHSHKSGYALSNEGKTLLVMADFSKPGDIMSFDLGESFDAITWRPVTGELLGYTNGKIHVIDPATGKTTNLGATFMEDAKTADNASVGFDFNNKIDAVRIVSSAGDNLVYFPQGFGNGDEKAGSVRRFTNLAYAAEDTNEGKTPAVFANAYTNAINGKTASGTAQYALDAETDSLVTLANNEGTLGTVGTITVSGKTANLAALGGFDIVSEAEGKDEAFAIMQMEGAQTAGLYSVDLATGGMKLIADLPVGGVTGFAVSLNK
ncbi:MAG: DUF4394 domain-containing protein [Pseudomonadota bacterium]